MPELPHLDEVLGVIARTIHLLRRPPRDTLDRLGAYDGLSRETLFPAPSHVPDVTRRRRWRLGGMESEDLSFLSLHEPLEPEFRRYYHARRRRIHTVYARRLRPDTDPGRPRLLYIHGYMQPETVFEEVAIIATMASMLGMEVVQLQPPYHGRRKPRSSRFDGDLYWTADLVRSLESLRQTLLDARTLLAWMRRESSAPVGVAGLSLGGAVSAALTCLEPGFAFAAPFIAHMDLGALVADAPVLATMRQDLGRFGWRPADFAAFAERIGWNELRPVLPVEQIQLFAADDDRFFRPEIVQKMWQRWGKPAIQWYPCSHLGFMTHLPDAIRRLRAFAEALELPSAPARRSGGRSHSGRSR